VRYLYRPDHPEASSNGFIEAWKDTGAAVKSAVQISVDRHYENLNLVDGTVVNSRRQHREYMNARGLTLATDFKDTWKKGTEAREKMRAGDFDRKERREALGRAAYEKGLL
jgi:hypothetical protein